MRLFPRFCTAKYIARHWFNCVSPCYTASVHAWIGRILLHNGGQKWLSAFLIPAVPQRDWLRSIVLLLFTGQGFAPAKSERASAICDLSADYKSARCHGGPEGHGKKAWPSRARPVCHPGMIASATIPG